jgi:hypothetical protein
MVAKCTSQIRAGLSRDAVTTRVPSGLKAAGVTSGLNLTLGAFRHAAVSGPHSDVLRCIPRTREGSKRIEMFDFIH